MKDLKRLKKKEREKKSFDKCKLLKLAFLNYKKLALNLICLANPVIIDFVGALF